MHICIFYICAFHSKIINPPESTPFLSPVMVDEFLLVCKMLFAKRCFV